MSRAVGYEAGVPAVLADRLEGVAPQVEEDLFELVPVSLNQGKRLKQAL